MPVLGADMDEGTVLEWLVKPGDEIRKGDVIAVIDTSKSAIDVESFYSGTIDRLVVDVGQTVPVGTVLALITEPGGERGQRAATAVPAAAAATAPAAEVAPAAAAAELASPPVRHRAHELGVDLAKVHGTGRSGSITRTDVERAAAQLHPATEPAGMPEHDAAAEHGAAKRRRAPRPAAPRKTAAAQEQPRSRYEPEHPAGRPRVTPRARVVAVELGVDLTGVPGTGPEGSVREADVRLAASGRRPAPPVGAAAAAAAPAARSAVARTQSMRQAIARLMARSKREIPHYYVSNTVDMTTAMSWLHDRNRELEVSERLVPAALLLKAAALAARQVPQLNGYWVDDEFRPAEAVHLGLAISLRGGGLLTPAIHDAAELELAELMTRMRDLVTRARTGRLRGSELTDGTITVTNLGDQGVESVFGVIYPPQVALVGFGKIVERPVAVGGLVGARPVVVTTLAADHRATDGYAGARYLTAISDLLHRPEEL
jgi:pyruvate dehydrogenase E2 component (dihydrolipoamide acetyltransferase)